MARIAASLGALALALGCAAHTSLSPRPAGDDAGGAAGPPTPDARPATPDVAPSLDLAAPTDTGASDRASIADASELADAPAGRATGCAAAAGLPEGPATISVGGTNRSYILRLPTGYTNARAWPLVLALHPNGGSGVGFFDVATGARSIRAIVKDKAILVLPQARPLGNGWDWRGDLPADLAYFEALIARLESGLCVDTARIFAMGFSGGGSFSGVLACRRHDIRAFAAGSGVEYYLPKDCTGPSAAWITVGADELIPARAAFRDDWLARDGCQPTMSATTPAPCQAYACPTKSPVHFCVHPGGHLWPDFGSAAAWDFFAQF